ncbi:hypothetical protein QL285_078570 [Trifolium repens]|nr:hypothetical protein QL285_078570 [Trifolium repens]
MAYARCLYVGAWGCANWKPTHNAAVLFISRYEPTTNNQMPRVDMPESNNLACCGPQSRTTKRSIFTTVNNTAALAQGQLVHFIIRILLIIVYIIIIIK